MSELIGIRHVRLAEHRWFDELRRPDFVWEGAPEDQEVLVVATAGTDADWAAYYQTPDLPADVKAVTDHGRKLPENVARDLFPAVRLRWRP